MERIARFVQGNPVLVATCTVMLVAALVFSALGVYRTTASLDEVIATDTPDDSYYYLLPALNFKSHGFFTFDGENPTYGFQPLWMVTLSAYALMFDSRMGFLRGVISLQYLLHAAAAVLLFFLVLQLAKKIEGPLKYLAALTAGLLFLFHPTYSQTAVTAKENALYVLLFALCLFPLIRIFQESEPRRRDFVLAALFVSLSAITRIMASTMLVSLAIAILLYIKGRKHWPQISIALFAAPLAWLIYAFISFGFLFPVSGSQKLKPFFDSLANGEFWNFLPVLFNATISYFTEYSKFALGFSSEILTHPSGLEGWPLLMGIVKLLLIAAAVIVVFLNKDLAKKMPAAKPFILLTLLVFTSALILPALFFQTLFHLFRYWNWYIVLAPLLTSLLAGLGILVLQGKTKYATIIAGIVMAVVLYDSAVVAASIQPEKTFTFNPNSFLHSALRAARFSNDQLHFGPEVRVGAFNAGLIGYFTDCTVINLDGLANDEAFRQIQLGGKSVYEYVKSENIEFMIDWMPYGGFFGNFFAHYELVAIISFVPEEGPPGISIVHVIDEPFPPVHSMTEVPEDSPERVSFLRARNEKVFGQFDNKLIRLIPVAEDPVHLSFDLGGEYTRLNCHAGVWPLIVEGAETPETLDVTIEILADGNSIKQLHITSLDELFEQMDLELQGVEILEFQVSTSTENPAWSLVYLAGMHFEKAR